MAYLRVWMLDKLIVKSEISDDYADQMIMNYKKCYKNYEVHKYNTDADILVEDAMFIFNNMYVIITKERPER